MSVLEIVSKVNITEGLWNESLEGHSIVPDEFDGIAYYRIVKKVGELKKGTVVTDSGIIYDFPRIARIMHLENGIKQAFDNPFYVEEKVDGYNVRIVKVLDQVFAFTRGSYVCPFSTDRLVDFFDYDNFFKKNPDLIVCGEIAGPESPYNRESPPYVTEDVSFFAFDIRTRNSDKQIPIEKRYKISWVSALLMWFYKRLILLRSRHHSPLHKSIKYFPNISAFPSVLSKYKFIKVRL